MAALPYPPLLGRVGILNTCLSASSTRPVLRHFKDLSLHLSTRSATQTVTNNHGRIESREHWLMEVPEQLLRATQYWANLKPIAMVRRTRQVVGKTSDETHYDISSFPLSAGLRNIDQAIRSHWAVENHLH
ncbi:hypothetical protein BH10PSE16_BH10PSE16_41850 [soil metagenome]